MRPKSGRRGKRSTISSFAGSRNRIHNVVAVGVFSMVRLSTPAAMSPCDVGNPFPAPLLTLEQVQHMFDDYKRCRELDVEATVVPDIFHRTGGHAGLVNMCGKAIDEEIRMDLLSERSDSQHRPVLTLRVWLQRVRGRLCRWIDNFPTTRSIESDLSGGKELQESCRRTLSKRCCLRMDSCRVALLPRSSNGW